MMLEYVGFSEAADKIERAVEESVRAGETTKDIGGTLSTSAAGDAIRRRLRD